LKGNLTNKASTASATDMFQDVQLTTSDVSEVIRPRDI
jgi:hypothetical protein